MPSLEILRSDANRPSASSKSTYADRSEYSSSISSRTPTVVTDGAIESFPTSTLTITTSHSTVSPAVVMIPGRSYDSRTYNVPDASRSLTHQLCSATCERSAPGQHSDTQPNTAIKHLLTLTSSNLLIK